MELKTTAGMIEKLDRDAQEFLERYGEQISGFLRTEETSAEESLQKELFLELMEHIYGIHRLSDYLKKDKVRMGTLEQDEEGEIRFEGEILPLMTELEVYIFEPALSQDIWTRTYVGGKTENKKYLVGIPRETKINGIPARIRE